MLVKVKRVLQNDMFTVEIDPKDTIKCFKEKIEEVKGHDISAKNMKLIFAGKFLLDSNRVCDYNVDERKFVIVAVKKPKAATPNREASTSGLLQHLSQGSSFLTFGQGDSAVAQQGHVCSSSCTHHAVTEREALARLMELGFARADVEAAYSRFNNISRAADYLLNNAVPSSSNNGNSETEASEGDPDHVPASIPVLDERDAAFIDACLDRAMGESQSSSGSESDFMPHLELEDTVDARPEGLRGTPRNFPVTQSDFMPELEIENTVDARPEVLRGIPPNFPVSQSHLMPELEDAVDAQLDNTTGESSNNPVSLLHILPDDDELDQQVEMFLAWERSNAGVDDDDDDDSITY